MIAAIVYAAFGPFHVPRLRAASALGEREGHTLVGIRVASTQADYQWPAAAGDVGDQIVTLFPDTDYWTLSYRRVRRYLCHILDQVGPQVVVLPGWGFKESVAGLGWCLRRRVPRVLVSDSQAMDNPPSPARHLAKGILVRRFHASLVGGAPHLRYVTELGICQKRCFVGCDVVDNQLFARELPTATPPVSKAPDRPKLLSCLRLLPRKNIFGVLESLASRPEWDWTIAGDGPQRPAIEARVEALGLVERVRLLGHVDYSHLPSIYSQADVYLQPSLSEPWGLAVNEAMACGLPVAVSNRCGCREDLVQPGVNGFTFDPGRYGDLARVLDTLLACRDRWHDMGRASQRIIGKWGLDLFARNFWLACEAAEQAGPARLSASTVNLALGLLA